MTQHSWKPSDFIEVKTGWHRNVLRISLVNKTANSSDDSLNLGPEPLAGFRHDVPGEGTPSPPWSSGSGSWFCCQALLWPLIQRRHKLNSPKGCNQGSWEARSPSPTRVLIEVSVAHNLFHGTSVAKPGDSPCSCSFLLIHLCRNVSVSFCLWLGKHLVRYGTKESIKNIIF